MLYCAARVDNWGNGTIVGTFDYTDYSKIYFGVPVYCIAEWDTTIIDRNAVWENRLCRIGTVLVSVSVMKRNGQASQGPGHPGPGPSLTGRSLIIFR